MYPLHTAKDYREAAERLNLLKNGYYRLTMGIYYMLAVYLFTAILFAVTFRQDPENAMILVLCVFPPLQIVGGFFIAFRAAREIERGGGVGIETATTLAILTAFCFGIVGIIILQTMATNAMERYGIGTSFMGVDRKQLEDRIAELRQASVAVP